MELQNVFYLVGGVGLVGSAALGIWHRRRNNHWRTVLIVSVTLLMIGFFFLDQSLRDEAGGNEPAPVRRIDR